MAQFADPKLMKRVAEARKGLIEHWAEGLSLEVRAGRSLEEIRHRVVADRLQLAASCERRGRQLLGTERPQYRDAISRFYYSTYHAFRAVAFFAHGGDDFEKHSELPSHLPTDLPRYSLWANDLKSAREIRNAADYDLYPKANSAWRRPATQLEQTAAGALKVSKDYLRARGCRFI